MHLAELLTPSSAWRCAACGDAVALQVLQTHGRGAQGAAQGLGCHSRPCRRVPCRIRPLQGGAWRPAGWGNPAHIVLLPSTAPLAPWGGRRWPCLQRVAAGPRVRLSVRQGQRRAVLLRPPTPLPPCTTTTAAFCRSSSPTTWTTCLCTRSSAHARWVPPWQRRCRHPPPPPLGTTHGPADPRPNNSSARPALQLLSCAPTPPWPTTPSKADPGLSPAPRPAPGQVWYLEDENLAPLHLPRSGTTAAGAAGHQPLLPGFVCRRYYNWANKKQVSKRVMTLKARMRRGVRLPAATRGDRKSVV